MIKRVLSDAGHSVVEACNGNEALRFVSEQRFAVAIIDILMPECDGFETIQALKKTQSHLKILAISGAPSFRSYSPLDAAETLGAHMSIAKPFDVTLLLKCTHQLLPQD